MGQHFGDPKQMNHVFFMFFVMMVLHLFVMPFVMIASPWDFRLSLTQFYAAVFMSAAMVACMGLTFAMDVGTWIVVAVLLTISVIGLRFQIGVSDAEYLHDMIPHHSMAVLTSRARLEKATDPGVRILAKDILAAQEKEIAVMKGLETQVRSAAAMQPQRAA